VLDARLAIRKLTTVMDALVYFDRACASSNASFGLTARPFARGDQAHGPQLGCDLQLQI